MTSEPTMNLQRTGVLESFCKRFVAEISSACADVLRINSVK
jgi:hypothetical protein